MADFSISIDGINRAVDVLDALPDKLIGRIMAKMQAAADKTFDASQKEVPVDTEDLKASGRVEPSVVGDREQINFDVTYGDGSSTGKTYNYNTSFSGAVEGDGYSWFVELGHMSRAGNPVPAQSYLGPAFEEESQKLLTSLGDILDNS